jgi:menaquinone-dependent protoporphyrinogen IX oxidase
MKRLLFVLTLTICFQQISAKPMEAKRVLIVYATATNSTKSIADSMKTYIESNGHKVDVISAKNNKVDLTNYKLIIIGSAIHANNPLPEALAFIDINREELSAKYVAVFAVCSTITSTKKKKYLNALSYADKVANGLKPISKNVFGGNFPSNGKKFDDFMAKLFLGIVPDDYRDWAKIKGWALELIDKINDYF